MYGPHGSFRALQTFNEFSLFKCTSMRDQTSFLILNIKYSKKLEADTSMQAQFFRMTLINCNVTFLFGVLILKNIKLITPIYSVLLVFFEWVNV